MKDRKPKQKTMMECERCKDAVALALSDAPRLPVSSMISVVKCPRCGSLVLDDYLGWKGSGVIFRGSADEILAYIEKNGAPLPSPLCDAIRAGLPNLA